MYDDQDVRDLEKAEEQLETLESWHPTPESVGVPEAYFARQDYTVVVKTQQGEEAHYEVMWPTESSSSEFKGILDEEYGDFLNEVNYKESDNLLLATNTPFNYQWGSSAEFGNVLHPESIDSEEGIVMTDGWPFDQSFASDFSELFEKTAPEELSEKDRGKIVSDVMTYLSI